MVKDIVIQELELFKKNDGLNNKIVYDDTNKDIFKLIEVILSECKYSVLDKNGNYVRYGSSTDIRVTKMLIKVFLSNLKVISPEIVSMALTKENIIGPFKEINFNKKYDEKEKIFDIEIEQFFPNEFNVGILKNNEDIREKFTNKILIPYVKEIILENDVLCSKYPIGSFINKKIFEKKDINKMKLDLVDILNDVIQIDKEYIPNIASYILVNIMNNKYFKNELIKRIENVSELQKLGKIHTGFSSMVNSMVCEVLQMLELKSFPYGEISSIKSTFYTTVAVLFILSLNLDNCTEKELVNIIKDINRNYCFKNRKLSKNQYRINNKEIYKYGNVMKIVNAEDIEKALLNLCFDIKNLINNKNEILLDDYIKEAIRIHYRFLRISPFEHANGRTARGLVNMLLKEKNVLAIFRREDRNEYNDSINENNKMLEVVEQEYIKNLSESTDKCYEIENEYLELDIPFLLIKF